MTAGRIKRMGLSRFAERKAIPPPPTAKTQ